MKTVIVYATLLGVALVGSYLSWTAEETVAVKADEVPIYRASEGDVQVLLFHDDRLDVRVERREDPKGPYAWISIEERRPKSPAVGDADAPGTKADDTPPDDGTKPGDDAEAQNGAEPEEGTEKGDGTTEPAEAEEPEVEIVRRAFAGGEKALDLFASYEPLMARRELDASLADTPAFGFDDPEGTITVVRVSGGEEKLVIGASTYGTRDRYAKHDGKLFLLADTKVRPLQFAASRLRERRLHPWLEADVERVRVERGGKVLVLEQRNRDDRAKAFWARPGEDQEDPNGATWVEKLLRLRVSSSPIEPEGTPEPALTVQITGEEGSWSFTLSSDGTEKGRFVDSDFLRSTAPVSATLADEIIADLDELLGE